MSKPELDQSDRWKQVEEELQEWGSKLEEIRANANDVGKDVIVDLEARYNSVLREVKELKAGTEPVLQSSRDKTASLADNLKEKAQAGLDTAHEKANGSSGSGRRNNGQTLRTNPKNDRTNQGKRR